MAKEALYLAYPPDNHRTRSEQIFFIGSGELDTNVTINGQRIQRSKQGYFAPSFPLKLGENRFLIRQGNQTIERIITRLSPTPTPPKELGFLEASLQPKTNLTRLVGDWICFEAIATPNAKVSVKIGQQTIPLIPQTKTVQLPPNYEVLTQRNITKVTETETGSYQGCGQFLESGNLGTPIFNVSLNNQTIQEKGRGNITIVERNHLQVIEVTAKAGVARTGPSTTYSRLTPLPQGTQAQVIGQEGDWLELAYGGWINQKETQTLPQTYLPNSFVRGISSQIKNQVTEISFPLKHPVPINIKQSDRTLTLTLYDTVAQTDTIYLADDPLIKRLDWQQITPNQVEYIFHFKAPHQWGYDVKYEGSNLILSLRHPPQLTSESLKGISILLDPGHGGEELGARGPNGYPEKAINLVISQLLEQELKQRGATVYLTREKDEQVSLGKRVEQINQLQPTLALSIHYNALPDSGDALNTAGIGMFWYHQQAHDLSQFLHKYLVDNLDRPSYGVYWNNLALTRPHTSPAVLLELGFMINPDEFEWITDPKEQQKLAEVLADGIEEWVQKSILNGKGK
ncbi:MAG: N-acetylmuramoyl-L-alanine amidase [Microcystaceae cyanobacterium]